MPYVRTNWQDGEAGGTPITAAALNNIETQHQVFDHMESVIAYGATGDGTTDDRAAIQAAIDAAAPLRRAVFFPPGEYNVGTGLVIPAPDTPVPLIGTPPFGQRIGTPRATWIKSDQSPDYLVRHEGPTSPDPSNGTFGWVVRNLWFEVRDFNIAAIRTRHISQVQIDQCQFQNPDAVAVKGKYAIHNTGVLPGETTYDGAFSNVTRCSTFGCGLFDGEGTNYWNFYGNTVHRTYNAYRFGPGSNTNALVGENWEECTSVDIWATSTSYTAGDLVAMNGIQYVCQANHTSSASVGTGFYDDEAAGRWNVDTFTNWAAGVLVSESKGINIIGGQTERINVAAVAADRCWDVVVQGLAGRGGSYGQHGTFLNCERVIFDGQLATIKDGKGVSGYDGSDGASPHTSRAWAMSVIPKGGAVANARDVGRELQGPSVDHLARGYIVEEETAPDTWSAFTPTGWDQLTIDNNNSISIDDSGTGRIRIRNTVPLSTRNSSGPIVIRWGSNFSSAVDNEVEVTVTGFLDDGGSPNRTARTTSQTYKIGDSLDPVTATNPNQFEGIVVNAPLDWAFFEVVIDPKMQNGDTPFTLRHMHYWFGPDLEASFRSGQGFVSVDALEGNVQGAAGDLYRSTEGRIAIKTEPAPGVFDTQSGWRELQRVGPTINDATTAITPALNQAEGYFRCNNASPIAVTIPTNASVPFPIGTKLSFLQVGAGQATIAGDGGVTVNNAGATPSQWEVVTVTKVATDEWDATGV